MEALDGLLLPSAVAPVGTSGAAALVAAPAQQLTFHVSGAYNLDLSNVQGNQHGVHAEGWLYLGDSTTGLHFTIDTVVKGTGNAVEGTPTMVFDDGSTLTFYYEVRRAEHGSIDFAGTYTIVGGTG